MSRQSPESFLPFYTFLRATFHPFLKKSNTFAAEQDIQT